MQFDSFEYAVFFLVVFLSYVALPRRGQNRMLLVASYFFYGFWNWKFLGLLWFSTVLDYTLGGIIHRTTDERRRKRLAIVAVAINLTFLGIFKYFNFFVESFHEMGTWLGFDMPMRTLSIVLPVGISFYTFQSMSYTLDIYWRRMAPARSLEDFALYVAFFPQLVAGPIERAGHLLPQFAEPRVLTRDRFVEGGWLIFWGLFKKVFVADNLAKMIDRVYGAPQDYSAPWLLLATYAFAIQIYCDFSGYTDMARGSAKWLGFELMLNFNLPYFARNPQDFWRRWHISLSQWLRDYLYIPLGGSRISEWRTRTNLLVTMVLGGLWHGAAWTFVIWGTYHGLLLMVHRALTGRHRDDAPRSRMGSSLAILGMFHLTCIGWLFFRLESVKDLPIFWAKFAGPWVLDDAFLKAMNGTLATAAPVIIIQLCQYFSGDLLVPLRFPAWLRVLLYVTLYFLLTIGGAFNGRQFIYFQF